MRIALGCDHAAVEMKHHIEDHLKKRGIETVNFTPIVDEENHDYPVYARKAAIAVKTGACDFGILICGTGVGMAMAANKIEGIRAASCSEAYTAKLAKEHNNANILCFGARVVGLEVAKMIVDVWLDAEFLGGRHARRVGLIEGNED